MKFVAFFLAGALLCNGIPHLTSGLTGSPFPTPFAKPRGVGASPPLVNFFWGAFNVIVGSLILSWNPVPVGFNPPFAALVGGALISGAYLAIHFGKVRRTSTWR